jgi:hypothetical protein
VIYVNSKVYVMSDNDDLGHLSQHCARERRSNSGNTQRYTSSLVPKTGCS